jgi:hypothetical protein
MEELVKIIKKKYNDFDITPQHLGQILRDNNITRKSEINNKLYKFYEKYIFRKLKLNGYINRKNHEQKMINNFKNIFGKPEDVIICAEILNKSNI